MKVIIAGSRSISSMQPLVDAIRESGFNVAEVVSGGARGVDMTGERLAGRHAIDLTIMYANWRRYGNRAGIIRNRKMADYADALIAVWDGRPKGTKNMIEEMEKLGKPVYVKTVDNRHKGE